MGRPAAAISCEAGSNRKVAIIEPFMPESEGALVPNSDSPQPYLSVVVAARNDDHGGNLLGRMQVFVDAWINQCRRHGLDSELIIVEWNPPAERARLAQALRWPADSGPCRVRIIRVPGEIHARYRHAAALPLYQMIAKNVGIRRARGQFILATNIDIVFSDEIVFLHQPRRRSSRPVRRPGGRPPAPEKALRPAQGESQP